MRDITKSYERGEERGEERGGTIGLDWLGGGWRIPASLVFLAWPSRPLSPHSSLPNSLSTPSSTSI